MFEYATTTIGHDSGMLGLPAVAPIGGGGLLVEVDHERLATLAITAWDRAKTKRTRSHLAAAYLAYHCL
jgi:hypothetical protein